MKVLVSCEYSGIVRDAFAERNHDAWSCDIIPTERPGNHIEGDVLDVLADGWDLMIGHPPCRYLSYAASRVWNEPGRAEKREKAFKFFMRLYDAPIPKVCIENPHGVPRVWFRPPDQTIHPYFFGDPAVKRTCLWLRGLPCLEHLEQPGLFAEQTHIPKPKPSWIGPDGRAQYRTSVVKDPKERARFWPGVAHAMATAWGGATSDELWGKKR